MLSDILFGGGDTWTTAKEIEDSANFILELPSVSYTGALTDIIFGGDSISRDYSIMEISAIRFPMINGTHIIRTI
jgi:hypothetical protein